ncbi:Lrp/AsnC family transcriptional regulator [Paracoccus pacificus]|uniref:Lrp/AsnC family transcriptional regulator n=1 Tax=Paracoccus pacificus TaxID=1463598 RepID=A0ABW4R9Z8_9RHOB
MADTANMDAIDYKIIAALQEDGRLSNVDLAERVGLSPSPCLRRVKFLEEQGVIDGYKAVINRDAFGLSLTVFVEIKVGRHSQHDARVVEASLSAIPGLVACHMVSGDADFLIELVVEDLKAYERVLTDHILTIDNVSQIRSNFSLRPICVERPLTGPNPPRPGRTA